MARAICSVDLTGNSFAIFFTSLTLQLILIVLGAALLFVLMWESGFSD